MGRCFGNEVVVGLTLHPCAATPQDSGVGDDAAIQLCVSSDSPSTKADHGQDASAQVLGPLVDALCPRSAFAIEAREEASELGANIRDKEVPGSPVGT